MMVLNMIGTTDDLPIYTSSWIDALRFHYKRNNFLCSRLGCKNKVAVGAHVMPTAVPFGFFL